MPAPQLTVGRKQSPYGYASGYVPTPKPKVIPKPAQASSVPFSTGAYGAPASIATPGTPLTTSLGAIQNANTALTPATLARVRPQNPLGERPNLQQMIAGDYEVADAEAAMASRMAGLRSGFTQNLRRALIDLGVGDTAKVGKFGSYIDQDTIAQAVANKYSANAQIGTQERIKGRQTAAALAARGALQSGQYTKSMGDITQDAEKSRYDALQQFLSGGEEGLTGLANEEYGLSQQVAQARSKAAERAAQYDLAWLNWQANQGGGDEGGDGGEEPGAAAPGAAPASQAPRLTVQQAYKALPAAVKKPQPKTPYGYASGYIPKRR